MPVLMSFYHLLQDLDKVLDGRLHCAIHLLPIRQGPVTFDLKVLKVLLDPFSCEIQAIVKDEGVWDPYRAMMLFLINFSVAAAMTAL